ncbi:hypothetical protein PRIPAC_70847 [Pristionchus pacificus]|uniref:CUB domain-containing protein n=1 Tax=Pristionchus pacificus TaxID=54126 RepID=A0A2A6C5C2_PRIPA|nr:hypothetical protein PRIPAC_70847 [Pristionchus pacificus]|eukprot:PDM73298.1 CUB domain-containing protein [Pristionchus pacificus]
MCLRDKYDFKDPANEFNVPPKEMCYVPAGGDCRRLEVQRLVVANVKKLYSCIWNQTRQLESSHDRKVFHLDNWITQTSCEYFEFRLTIYELVTVNGIVYRVPRHRNDFPREEYVGARDTAFLLIIKSKKEAHELDIHYSYTTSSDYNHLRLGNLNYSCPFPLISLNDDNPRFLPSDDFIAFDCAVQINSTSNVQRLMHYEGELATEMNAIYHTYWTCPNNVMNAFMPSMNRKLNSSEDHSEIALFGSSFVISFWQSLHKQFKPFNHPYLIELAPSCLCENDTDREIGLESRAIIRRTLYEHIEGVESPYSQCFHIECSRTIYMNPSLESTYRINMRVLGNRLRPTVSVIDGNFTIDNNSPNMSSIHHERGLHFALFMRLNIKSKRESGANQCRCPSISGSFAHFEFPPTCDRVDCIFNLTGSDSHLTYDPYHDCTGDRVLYRSYNGEVIDIYRGRNIIRNPIDEPVMVLFHRTKPCEQHSFSVVALGAPREHHVVFSINDFDVADDQLKIFFGESRDDYMMSFTSYEEDPDEVDSGERDIMINFVSDDMEQGKGYNITVRAIPFEKVEEGMSWWMIGLILIVASAIAALGCVQRDRIRNGITVTRMGRRFGGAFTNPFVDNDDQFL